MSDPPPEGPDPWRSPTWWSGARLPLAASTGLDPRAYVDEAYHAAERRLVFERAWVCVGAADEVARPGRVLVRQVGRRSVLVLRDSDGILRAFLNTCRHRGTELVATDGEVTGVLRCPYHRWGYALDGSLVATPQFEEVPRHRFGRDDHGLIPVRVDTAVGLLFACLDPATPPLATWLGDLVDRLAGYGLDRWRVREERTLHIAANWKLVSENYQEYYHLRWVHPELAKVSRVSDHYRYQGPGMYCGQTTTPVSGGERDDWLRLPPAEGLDRSDRSSGRFVAVFPNVLLSILPNHALVMRLEPDGPASTTETCTFLLPEGTIGVDEAAFGPTRAFWFEVNDEDIDIVERGQRGLTTAAAATVPPGPLSPRFEEPLHRFHAMLADHVTLDHLSDLCIPLGDAPGADEALGTGPNPTPPTVDLG